MPKEWNGNFFKRYLSNYKISVFSIFSALSVLRHHGTPTPLLDWSRNPLVALLFAAHSTNHYNTDCEIEQYFSLYEMKEEHPVYGLDSRGLILKHVKNQEERLRSHNQERAKDNPYFVEQFSEAYVNDEE